MTALLHKLLINKHCTRTVQRGVKVKFLALKF